MPFIDQKEIFEKTDGGRLVIEEYYPQSVESFLRYPVPRPFKCRLSEKTASSSLKRMPDGVWLVTDFGDDQQPRNAIQIVMKEEGLDFGKAINLIAAKYNLVGEAQRSEVYKPEIRKVKAKKDEEDGTFTFETKEFTLKEIQLILAPKVWEYLCYMVTGKPAAEQEAAIIAEVVKVFKKYSFYSLASYTQIKDREAITIRSTEQFPVFMFDEGDWKKIYKPREVQGNFRFMYAYGDKRPKNFMFGYDVAVKAYTEITKIEDDGEIDAEDTEAAKIAEENRKKKLKNKLQSITIVSGGSDGLNLAVIGQCFKNKETIAECFYPVWLNSETAKLSKGQWDNISRICKTVYNLPDIDATGKREAHKLALEYLEIKTIYLPEELKSKFDTFRRKPMKDLRDYFKHYKVWDFFTLIKTAYPYKFWDASPPTEKRPKWSYDVNNKHLYNFLARNGFYRFETEAVKDGYIYIFIEGNIVRQIEPKKVRDYVNAFIEQRHPDVELMNTFLRTNQLNEGSLSNLPYIQIDFTDFDKNSQWFFFLNGSCEITRDGVREYRPGETDKFVWEDEVIQRRVKLLPDFFTITSFCNIETRQVEFDIEIHNQECMVMRYLVNASRVHWRPELEDRLEGIPEKEREDYVILHQFTVGDEKLLLGLPKEEQENYRTQNKWNLAGPLLTDREQHEQKMQFINKIFSIGYIFHRYKEPGKAWAIWSMDSKLTDADESHGGSGKSLLPMLVFENKLMKTQYREGRNPKLIDNPHIYENIDRHTDLLIIDDCNRYLKFDFFFSAITGPITVNPKNNKQYTVPFKESPKLWFSSNYPPHNIDPSMERRILYNVFSDYYHYNKMGEYREERRVLDDFGKNLGSDFNVQEWNLFANFLMQCTKFYLNCTTKINAPMDNVNKRNLKNAMGESFERWADVYFADNEDPNETRLNKKIIREEAHNDYLKSENPKVRTTNDFSKKLAAWCYYNGYEYNPKELQNSKGRIVENITIEGEFGQANKRKTVDMIFIKSVPVLEGVVARYNAKQGKELAASAGGEEETCPI